MRYTFQQKDYSLPLFVDSFGTQWQQAKIQRPQGYPYVHWLLTEKGVGTVLLENEQIALPAGTSILINQNIAHDYFPETDWQTAYFTFGGALISEIMTLLGLGSHLVLSENSFAAEEFVQQLATEIQTDSLTAAFKTSSLVYTFLMLVKEATFLNTPSFSKYHQLLQPVINYIQKNYAKEIRSSELAQLVGYSPQYLNRLFHEVYKTSPTQYLLAYRLQKAKELLANQPFVSVQEISEATGFSNVSHFIALFKRSEKVTPLVFRRYYQTGK